MTNEKNKKTLYASLSVEGKICGPVASTAAEVPLRSMGVLSKALQPYCAGQYCQFVIPRVTTGSLYAYRAEKVTRGTWKLSRSDVGLASGMARAFARLTARLILPSIRICILDGIFPLVNTFFIHSRRDGAFASAAASSVFFYEVQDEALTQFRYRTHQDKRVLYFLYAFQKATRQKQSGK